jgi:hypothetical protein
MTQALATTEAAPIQKPSTFDDVARHAAALSKSDIIPEAYRNKPGNCLIALEMAERMGCAPMQIMQAMYVVHGTPGWSSKWLIATANASGKFTPIRWRFLFANGRKVGAIAYATDRETKELLEGPEVTLEMAKAEGWLKNPKWTSMAEVMLMYRSAAFWVRMYCPEVAMGLHTAEEIEDVRVVQQPAHRSFSAALANVPEAPALPPPGSSPGGEPVADASFDPETGEVG